MQRCYSDMYRCGKGSPNNEKSELDLVAIALASFSRKALLLEQDFLLDLFLLLLLL